MRTYIHGGPVNMDCGGKTKESSLLFRKPNGINWSCIRDAALVFSLSFSSLFFSFLAEETAPRRIVATHRYLAKAARGE